MDFSQFIESLELQVFGAYCSTRWFERNLKDDNGHRQAYFGTGETFLFSLYPERAKYPWVGIDGDKGLGHGSELFMAADASMITIGGGYIFTYLFCCQFSENFCLVYQILHSKKPH